MEINNKKKIINEILETIQRRGKKYSKKYNKTKNIDDVIDSLNTVLSGLTVALIITGLSFPPLLIASACCCGMSFLIERIQVKIDLKYRYNQYGQLRKSYYDLHREFKAVITKNDLNSEKLSDMIAEINSRISLIEDDFI